MLKKITVLLSLAIAGGAVVTYLLKKREHNLKQTHHDSVYSSLHEWNASLQREIIRSHRDARDVCVALIELNSKKITKDSDEFEKIQREFVHAVRGSDLIARNDHGEFYILFPESGLDEGYEAIERLQEVLPPSVSISAGIAVWDHCESAAELVSRGIKSLQTEKNTAKAKISVAKTPQVVPH